MLQKPNETMAANDLNRNADGACPQSDFFFSGEGTVRYARWRRSRHLLSLLDAATEARIAVAKRRARKAARDIPIQTVLLTGIEVPGRESDLSRAIEQILATTRHNVRVATTRMQPVGKFDNVNSALTGQDLSEVDWLLVVDDDIEVPKFFLDLFLYFCYANKLKLAQPAHRFSSHKSFTITERHWASQVRSTGFIESGPISLFHRDTFADLIPFPSLRWTWGVDVFWAHKARLRGWRMGIADAVPIRHLRPVGGSYNMTAAHQDAVEFLRSQRMTISRAEVLGPNHRIQ
jgi:hypothetical protein